VCSANTHCSEALVKRHTRLLNALQCSVFGQDSVTALKLLRNVDHYMNAARGSAALVPQLDCNSTAADKTHSTQKNGGFL
jgi:hypothetical protein